ncbi:hypothetical protein [Vreelandella utahensis]|uniref:hypothetical protein n=1 Tax=Vreelandella halophila TaxID=86177 RepID=UPI0011799E09|nr:hypothetical protein [Halomonas utahensis]
MTACSGGSGGGGSEEPPLAEREQAQSYRVLTPITLPDESGERERPVPEPDADAVASVATDRADALGVALSAGRVVLTPKDVDRPVTARVALLDGEGRRVLAFDVNLVNEAGEPERRRAQTWLESRPEVLALAEDCALARTVAAAAYFNHELDYPAYRELTRGLGLPFTGEAPELEAAFADLSSALAAYRQGESAIDALAAQTDAVRDAAQRHQSQHAAGPVARAHDAMPPWAAPPERGLRYHSPSGRVSSLTGNASVGSQGSDGWRFDAQWAHLAGIPTGAGVPECQEEAP